MQLKYIITTAILSISVCANAQFADGDRMSEEDIIYQDKFIEAKGYLLLDRADKSEEILKDLYKEKRNNPAVALELAILYRQLDDPMQEYKYAKVAADNASGNIFILEKYSDICMRLEKYNEAATALKQIVKIEPSSEKYSDKLATALIKHGESDEAINVYNELEKQIGITQDVSRRKFELYDLMGKSKPAIQELEKLVDAFPENLASLHKLAAYHDQLGDKSKAKLVYEKILAIDVNDTKANIALMGSADNIENEGNYLRALAPIIENKEIHLDNKILELIPYVQKIGTPSADPELAPALVELSHRLLAIHPKEAKGHAIQGDIFFLSGNTKDAIKSYNKTLSIKDNVYNVWEQLMYAYQEVGDYNSLRERAEGAIDYFPNKPTAFYFYGLSSRKLNKLDDAISYLDEGVLIAGKNIVIKSNILSELALAYLANRNEEKATNAAEKALELSQSQNPNALEAMGDILTKKGDQKAAKEYYNKAKAQRNTGL